MVGISDGRGFLFFEIDLRNEKWVLKEGRMYIFWNTVVKFERYGGFWKVFVFVSVFGFVFIAVFFFFVFVDYS